MTFALFAYNQEKYIREAIEGAFAQTYEPLEIILSDDCSTDRTFEIMQEMAGGYSGQHTVRIRQSEQNVGTLSHVLSVAREAKGDIFVVAAGDDVSKPERTNTIVSAFRDTKADILSGGEEVFVNSRFNIITVTSGLGELYEFSLVGSPRITHIHGASSAYNRHILCNVPIPNKKILLEDIFFRIVGFWRGCKIIEIPDALVQHRLHEKNVGPSAQEPSIIDLYKFEQAELAHWSRMEDLLLYLKENWSSLTDNGCASRNAKYLINENAIEYFKLKNKWLELSVIDKFKFFVISREFPSRKSDILRSFGWTAFSWAMACRAILRNYASLIRRKS